MSTRWKSPVLACAIVVAATSVVGPDQPVVMMAKNPSVHPRVVVAMARPLVSAAPIVPSALTPSAITVSLPVIADTTIAPPSVAAEPSTVAASREPQVAAVTPPIVPVAKIPAPVIISTPNTIGTTGKPAVTANLPVAETRKPAPSFDGRILAAHNQERENLGLEPLNWNPALAESAQRWAEHLAQTGRFEHAPENRTAPEGENLWAGSKGYYTPEAMVAAWIREKKFFRPGVFPDNSITGRVEDIGHYTQVVWRATRQVGCAEATSANEDILVCRYAEAGNYRGEQPF